LLPARFQTIMTSATLNEDLSELKRTFVVGKCVSLKLKEADLPGMDQLEQVSTSTNACNFQKEIPTFQFHIACLNDEERFSILLALIKLKLLVGKSVIFVSTVDRCYKFDCQLFTGFLQVSYLIILFRLQLFLQAFKVPACVLNAQMPANSRCRIIHEFNQGRWPFLIASECNDVFDEAAAEAENAAAKKEAEGSETGNTSAQKAKKSKKVPNTITIMK
jgi:ATP-dependent RNA helicase DDX56/DBP9